MSRQLYYRIAAGALVSATTLAAANAQNARETPTNVPRISVVAPPPAGFDPIAASAAGRPGW